MNLKGSQSKLLISINDKLYSMFLVKKTTISVTGFWSRKVYLLTSSTHSGLPALLSATYLSEPCETCTLHCATAPLRHPRWNPELKDWGFFLAWTCKQPSFTRSLSHFTFTYPLKNLKEQCLCLKYNLHIEFLIEKKKKKERAQFLTCRLPLL